MPDGSPQESDKWVKLPLMKELRQNMALTQEELATEAGVSRQTVLRLERGERTARPSTVRKIARALRVRPYDLMVPNQLR
jgi:DNA-binding XRE family transcriptional regulator